MKNKPNFPPLTFVLCLFACFVGYGSPEKNYTSDTRKTEEQKEKLRYGELSQEPYAFTENKGQVYGYDGLPHPEVKFVFERGGAQIFLLEKGLAYQFTKTQYPENYFELTMRQGAEDHRNEMSDLQKRIRTETYRMDMTLSAANSNCRITCEGRGKEYTNYYTCNVMAVHSYSRVVYHEIYPGIDWVIYLDGERLKYDFVVHPGADPSRIKMQFKHQEELGLNKDGSFTLKNVLGSITEKSPISFQNNNEIKTRFILNANTLSFKIGAYDPGKTLVIDPVLVWATYYGGTDNDWIFSSCTDLTGNVYTAGRTVSTSNIASGGHQLTYGGSLYDAFLVKFNSSGVRVWSTYYGGAGVDYGYSCSADAAGDIYLAGYTTSTANIASGGHQNVSLPSGGAFLVKFNTLGIRQWCTYYDAVGNGESRSEVACSTDALNNVYLAGRTGFVTNVASGGHQNTNGGGVDAFLVKFNSAGVRQWATYHGGPGTDYGYSCCTDASGNVYMSGLTTSSSNIASGSAHQTVHSGTGLTEAFLVKYNSSGIRQWSTYYGGTADDWSYSCATDISGNVYMSGVTRSFASIGSGGHQNALNGAADDAFLVKFNTGGVRLWGTYYGGTSSEEGFCCTTDGAGNVYLAGRTASSADIASGGYQNTSAGGHEGFLAKFDAGGVRQWGTFYGGTSSDIVNTCCIDVLSNIYIAGLTNSPAGIALNGHQNSHAGGIQEGFLAKFCNAATQLSTIVGNTAVCNGTNQTYSVAVSAGTTSYTWSIPGGWSGTSSTNTIEISPSSSGAFSLVASGACGASSVQTLSITVNALPSISVNSGSFCSGSSFTINPSGANTYSIQGGNTIVSPLSNASYTVRGLSAEGCISQNIATSNVTVNITPTVSANSGSFCTGNSFTIIPSGANTYSIQGGNTIVSPLSNASYTVRGLSAEGCISQNIATSNVTVNITPTVSANSGSFCTGNSFTIIPSGANTYSIQGGNTIVSPLSNASYTVRGLSAEGCISQNIATSNVTVNITPTVSANSGSFCTGNSFTIIPSGANTYSIQGGNTIVSPLSNASYTVRGLSAEGCISQNIATSNVTVNITPTVSVNSGSFCTGNSFTIVPSGANTYSIQGGIAVVSPLSNTSYTVRGLSIEGCISQNIATSNVTVSTTPTVSVNSGSFCTGSSFTIVPSGANTYSIQGGTAVVSPLSNTSYTVRGLSIEGCISQNIATSNITVNTTPTVSANSGSICSGASFTIIPSGANTYTIQGGNTIVSPLTNASYTIEGVSAEGCISQNTATSNVMVNTTPTLSVNSGSICSGASFTIIPSGANTYTIQGGNTIVSPLNNSGYTVTGASAEGCSSQNTATSNVTVNTTPTVAVNSGSICAGQVFTLLPQGAVNYTYSGGSATVSPGATSSYTITGTSNEGCGSSAVSTVTVNALPAVQINGTLTTICAGESLTLSASGAITYVWDDGSGGTTLTVSPIITTNYSVTGKDNSGCTNVTFATQVVDVCTGIQMASAPEAQILIYPNPNLGSFIVESDQSSSMVIINSLGQIMLQRDLEEGKSSIDLTNHATGIYFITIKQTEKTITVKLIKE